jgi:Molecular chaperone GrpE (heat shock protein)
MAEKEKVEIETTDEAAKKEPKAKKLTALEAAKKEAAEYKDMALRKMADLENYRRNNQNLAKDVRDRTVREVLEAFLPAVDGFNRAEELVTDEKTKNGIGIIKEQLLQVLKRYNVTEIEAQNAEFDPNLHECIMQVEDAELDGKVKYEIRKGYKIGDAVLRHSQVAVAVKQK